MCKITRPSKHTGYKHELKTNMNNNCVTTVQQIGKWRYNNILAGSMTRIPGLPIAPLRKKNYIKIT